MQDSRVVFGSSIAVYGDRADVMREDDPPSASVNLYGTTERLGEILGAQYSSLYGLQFVALRYSGVFGPSRSHSRGMSLVRQMVKDGANGKDVHIEGASGDERIHLTHVTGAAKATV